MKVLGAFLLAFICLVTHAQTDSSAGDTRPAKQLTVADFGLAYPLSQDWVQATQLMRSHLENTKSAPGADVLLAAVYVPKSTISTTNPFFTLLALRQPSTDCKRYLEASIAHSQGEKSIRIEGGIVPFSAAGRDYYRIAIHDVAGPHHREIICTTATNHLLLWNAGASNSKGLDAILETLNVITPLPAPPSSSEQTAKAADDASESSQMAVAKATRVRATSGMVSGLLIKKVNPIYPEEARHAYIQGTVIFKAEISKTGDITELELLDGPIELAGSAVNAVRQWKYRPYLLNGEPVTVVTQIQVNYALGRR
jgi:TonB family protein